MSRDILDLRSKRFIPVRRERLEFRDDDELCDWLYECPDDVDVRAIKGGGKNPIVYVFDIREARPHKHHSVP